jgi:hypothetical protein
MRQPGLPCVTVFVRSMSRATLVQTLDSNAAQATFCATPGLTSGEVR